MAMTNFARFLLLLLLALSATASRAQQDPAGDGKLRIICFGAHPDDCEFQAGGVAAKWAAAGHHVKFVAMTNGDIGHYRMAGAPLALRRTAEVQAAAKILGIETEVLDIHDGELEPTLENRRKVTRLIRQWKADVVMCHRPNDYHPDHRYTGVLVQDSAFMVAVPFFCPDTPPLKANPVFLYFRDRFKKPNAFVPDVAVSIDDVWEQKLRAMDVLVSQVAEGGVFGSDEREARIPRDPALRLQQTAEARGGNYERIADEHRDLLKRFYGAEAGERVQRAEVFEICEYGRQPTEAELRKLFPFYGKE
jgi:LmbE family N-acetylglucosaminyl deacetylase